MVINAVGRELYELFFRGYTRKQWGLDPSELDKQVTSRIPTRTNTDDRYFSDTFQAMPSNGYTAMFEKMLDSPLIEIRTGADFRDLRDEIEADHIIYTGPIDEYFDFRFGKLPYRSAEVRSSDARRGAAPAGRGGQLSRRRRALHPHQRIQASDRAGAPATTITYEYPTAEGDPYYPIPRDGESGAVQEV